MKIECAKQFINREECMDIAKGVAILAVIAGHVNTPGITARIIYSFHIPLFFIINGYFVKNYDIHKTFLRSCKSLITPYIIGTVMEMLCEMVNAKNISSCLSSVEMLTWDMIGGLCKPNPNFPLFHGTWDLWFLPCLFLSRNIFVVLMNLTETQKYKWIIRVFVFLFLAKMGQMLGFSGYFPWGLEIALISLPFLLFGHFMRKYKVLECNASYVLAVLCLIVWGVLLSKHHYMELAMHYYPYFYVEIIEAVLASFFVICFSKVLEKCFLVSDCLQWIGRYSIVILLLHNMEMRFISWDRVLRSDITNKWYIVLLVKICFVLLGTGIFSIILFAVRKKDKPTKCL